MKVALAQIEVLPGRPNANLETMLSMIDEAKKQGVDLIAFPEMCVGGYLLGDKHLNDGYSRNLMEFNEALRQASDGIAIAYGNIFLDDAINSRLRDETKHPNKDGRTRRYNAVYVFQNGAEAERKAETGILPIGVQPKTLHPNYRIFDDERFFFSLQDIAKDAGVAIDCLEQPFLIEINGKKVPVGFEICEDLWCEDYRLNGTALNPTKMLIDNGAELIVNISASPWTYGKNGARDRRVMFLKEESGDSFVPFLYVNCTGVQNNGKNFVTFDGGSTAYNAEGYPFALSSAAYKPELIIVDSAHIQNPIGRSEESKIAQKYKAIVEGLRHIKDTLGNTEDPRFVIGLSGGIDSAVVAALLAQAVGAGKILGVNMPTQYNSELTKGNATYVAEKLGIAYEVIPIETLVEENARLIEEIDPDGTGRKLTDLNMENVQAKIRGTSILSNLAAKYGAIFTNNGNKLEVALGYATLYGDIGGAIAPIADLTKTEVFEMARYLNEHIFHSEVIPTVLLPDELYRFKDGAAPSAELKKKQIDPMKFGYHDALLSVMTDYVKKGGEDILQWYLDGTLEQNLGISTQLIERWNIDDPSTFVKDLEWFCAAIERSVFKRVQGPPIIITSKSSYGYDIRESILPYEPTCEFGRLKEKVLRMGHYAHRKALLAEAA